LKTYHIVVVGKGLCVPTQIENATIKPIWRALD
jgi:hypothetical protein